MMGYTCQTILKHTNSVQMAENATTHSCTHLQYACENPAKEGETKQRGRREFFYIYIYIFHSAEGCQRYNEPQRAPKPGVVKNVYCTSGPCLYFFFFFFLFLRHLTDHRKTQK